MEAAAESGYTSGSEDENTVEAGDDEFSLLNKSKEGKDDSDYSDSDSDSSDEDEAAAKMDEGGFEVVPQQKIKKRKALTCEELALGEQMVHSKKRKRDIMDAGWNRYMFEDTGLPDWFVKEEEIHMKRRPDVDPETVQKYRFDLFKGSVSLIQFETVFPVLLQKVAWHITKLSLRFANCDIW